MILDCYIVLMMDLSMIQNFVDNLSMFESSQRRFFFHSC